MIVLSLARRIVFGVIAALPSRPKLHLELRPVACEVHSDSCSLTELRPQGEVRSVEVTWSLMARI
jgi:hypothetical protein